MNVRSTNAQRVYTSAPWRLAFWPISELRVRIKRTVRKVYLWVRLLKMQARRNLTVMNGQGRFDKADDARSNIEMANVCFYRTNWAELFSLSAEPKRLRKTGNLDWIA